MNIVLVPSSSSQFGLWQTDTQFWILSKCCNAGFENSGDDYTCSACGEVEPARKISDAIWASDIDVSNWWWQEKSDTEKFEAFRNWVEAWLGQVETLTIKW